jgi:hypothetical protein
MRFGIDGHLYPDIRAGEEALYAATKEIDKLGMVWLRHPGSGIAWYEIQPTKDTWDFKKLDAVINNNRHPWIIPTYGMIGNVYPFNGNFSREYMESLGGKEAIIDHIKSHSVDMLDPQQKADAEVYVKTLVNRYKDKILYWEIGGNEGLPHPGKFEIITNTYSWIKEVHPQAQVLITANCGDDDRAFYENMEALDGILAEGATDSFDIANLHYYGKLEGDFEERLEKRFDEYKAILEKHGVDKPIWVTETSTASYEKSVISPGGTEQRQARDVVKRLVIFAGKGAEKVFWYDYGELKPGDKFYGCNLINDDGPKPAYYTFKLTVDKIGFYDAVGKLRGDNVWLYRFVNPDGSEVFVAWAKSSQTVDLSQYIDKDTVLVTHIVEDSGVTLPATETVKTSGVELSGSPIFIEVGAVSLSQVAPMSEAAPTVESETPLARRCTPTLPQEGPTADAYTTVIEPFDLLAPSGNIIYGQIRRPDPALYPELCFPAVVFVPGGINPGRMEIHGRDAKLLAEAGMVVVGFNAEGRVDEKSPEDIRSEGEEDYNGFRHQEGLCKVVEYVVGLDYVLADNVGLKTQSYGITMGAGCAGRHPEIPIKYIVDGEGPPYSFVTCHGPRYLAGDMKKYNTVKDIFGREATWQDSSPQNLDWWAGREAINFIGAFQGYYLRLQATWDHAQPPESEADIPTYHHPEGWPGGGPAWWHNKHSADIVNAAVAGGVPWVRVNLPEQGNAVNATYDANNPPVFLPGKLADKPWDVRAVLEMARME